MKEIKSKTNDFKVNAKGEAFISMGKTAELCGVSKLNIQRDTAQDDTSQGLSPKILSKVIRINAIKGISQSIDLLDQILEAGATAFIYYNAEIVTPEQLKIANLQEDLKIEKSKVKIKKIGMSSQANRRSLHDQREELFDNGMCDRITREVTHFYYPVNDKGLSAGHTNIGKGITKTINLTIDN